MNKVRQFTTPELTSADFSPIEVSATGQDLLVRIVADSTSASLDVRWANTMEVAGPIRRLIEAKNSDISMLVDVVRWQHKLLDYNSHYNAYLLEQTTEEEFESIAEGFSYEPLDIAPDVLAPHVKQVYQLTNIPYTPSDLADFFHCNHRNTMDAVLQIAHDTPIVQSMLPQIQHTEAVE